MTVSFTSFGDLQTTQDWIVPIYKQWGDYEKAVWFMLVLDLIFQVSGTKVRMDIL